MHSILKTILLAASILALARIAATDGRRPHERDDGPVSSAVLSATPDSPRRAG